VKRRHLERWTVARRRAAGRYAGAFRRVGLAARVGLPQEQPGCRHVYHLYTVRLDRRERVRRALERQGIATQVAYPGSLPDQPALVPWRRGVSACPEARKAGRQVLSLPLYPELSARAIDRIVSAIRKSA
jgi:dTDP-4-amino-4,6-dideoxygalactose transaminase